MPQTVKTDVCASVAHEHECCAREHSRVLRMGTELRIRIIGEESPVILCFVKLTHVLYLDCAISSSFLTRNFNKG